jgi:uracil-DNA glycosylase
LEISTLDDSWLAVLYPELTKPYFLGLKQFLITELDRGRTIFPPQKDIYSWSRLTPLNSVKVVILGQDPYHNHNQAHGLAFSVTPPTPPPPSLQNIYKGVANCYSDFKTPSNGLLTPWASRGVLLLNACLTVQAHNANSHAGKGWETFTEQVLMAALKSRPSGICFLAWGTPAAKRVDKIRPGNQHLVLKSVHPSPLSATRGFFTCQHFRKANEWLRDTYGPSSVVDWALDPDNKITDIHSLLAPVVEPAVAEDHPDDISVAKLDDTKEIMIEQLNVDIDMEKSTEVKNVVESTEGVKSI